MTVLVASATGSSDGHRRETTVNPDLRARDEAGGIGEQPKHRAYKFLRPSVASHSGVAEDRSLALGRDEILHGPLCWEKAGAQRVHANTLCSPLSRKVLS